MSLLANLFAKYGNFADRARRREFFIFIFFNNLFFQLFLYVDGNIGTASRDFTIGWLSGIWALFMIVPTLAILARRMHDIGRSGWWSLLLAVPVLNDVFCFWTLRNSELGANAWGPNPKSAAKVQVAD